MRIFHVRALRNYHVIINERVFILYLRLELHGSLNRFASGVGATTEAAAAVDKSRVLIGGLDFTRLARLFASFFRSVVLACIGFLCKLHVLCLCCCSRLDIRVVVDAVLSIFKLRKSKKAIINVECENNDGKRRASIQKAPTVIF